MLFVRELRAQRKARNNFNVIVLLLFLLFEV